MPFPNLKSTPQKVTDYLHERLTRAQDDVKSYTKHSVSGRNQDSLTKMLLDQYKLKPLKLEKHTATMTERVDIPVRDIPYGERHSATGPNYRDTVTVIWPIEGSYDLLKLSSTAGNVLVGVRSVGDKRHLQHTYQYPLGLATHDDNKQALKTRILDDGAGAQMFIDSINESVLAYNSQLSSSIPELLAAKLKAITNLKSTEDFLNS